MNMSHFSVQRIKKSRVKIERKKTKTKGEMVMKNVSVEKLPIVAISINTLLYSMCLRCCNI